MYLALQHGVPGALYRLPYQHIPPPNAGQGANVARRKGVVVSIPDANGIHRVVGALLNNEINQQENNFLILS
jgi:hypothetical protein